MRVRQTLPHAAQIVLHLLMYECSQFFLLVLQHRMNLYRVSTEKLSHKGFLTSAI